MAKEHGKRDMGTPIVDSSGPVWGGAKQVGEETTIMAAASHASATARQKEEAARAAMEEANQAQREAAKNFEEAMAKAAAAKKRAEEVARAAAEEAAAEAEEDLRFRDAADAPAAASEATGAASTSVAPSAKAAVRQGGSAADPAAAPASFGRAANAAVIEPAAPSALPAPSASLSDRVDRIKEELELSNSMPLAMAIMQANTLMGLEPVSKAIPVQVAALLAAMGLDENGLRPGQHGEPPAPAPPSLSVAASWVAAGAGAGGGYDQAVGYDGAAGHDATASYSSARLLMLHELEDRHGGEVGASRTSLGAVCTTAADATKDATKCRPAAYSCRGGPLTGATAGRSAWADTPSGGGGGSSHSGPLHSGAWGDVEEDEDAAPRWAPPAPSWQKRPCSDSYDRRYVDPSTYNDFNDDARYEEERRRLARLRSGGVGSWRSSGERYSGERYSDERYSGGGDHDGKHGERYDDRERYDERHVNGRGYGEEFTPAPVPAVSAWQRHEDDAVRPFIREPPPPPPPPPQTEEPKVKLLLRRPPAPAAAAPTAAATTGSGAERVGECASSEAAAENGCLDSSGGSGGGSSGGGGGGGEGEGEGVGGGGASGPCDCESEAADLARGPRALATRGSGGERADERQRRRGAVAGAAEGESVEGARRLVDARAREREGEGEGESA